MSCSEELTKYTVRQGALDPVALRVIVASSDVVEDLTLVTSVELEAVDRRSAASAAETWTASITAQTAAELTAEHRYELTDTATPRTWRVDVWLTVTGAANPVHGGTFLLQVMPRS